MTNDTYPISTAFARLFLALAKTLYDPELLTDLQPAWEVQPGISTFSLSAQRRVRARLADLDPAELHRRLLMQGVSKTELPELLTTFRLPLTGTPEESRAQGWTVLHEAISAEDGVLVWMIYAPESDPEAALGRFRKLFFPGQPDSGAFRAAVIVLPGQFLHPGAAPGQGKALEMTSSGEPESGVPEHRPISADPLVLPPEDSAQPSWFTRWTNLDLPPGELLRLFGGDLPVPADVHSLRVITRSFQDQFRLTVDEVARLLGVSRSRALRRIPPELDVLDRLYALGGLIGALTGGGAGQSAVAWFTQPLLALGGRRPVDLCHTRYGLARVEELLHGLLDGIFS